jgi:GxxExxY protein
VSSGKYNEDFMARSKLITTPYDALTYKIVGCAMAVHREMGPGFREDTYQRALESHLEKAGVRFHSQKMYEVYDPDHLEVLLGYYIPDFVVGDKVVVEIKALQGLNDAHKAQAIGYLAVTRCPIALLINFGQRSLVHERVFPPKNITEHCANRQWLFVPNWLRSDPN